MRYTVTNLRRDVENVNQWLESTPCLQRLETGSRNGYQAVDIYSIDASGGRIGSGVDSNLECGTSRECGQAALAWYGSRFNAARIQQLQDNNTELERKVDSLSARLEGSAM